MSNIKEEKEIRDRFLLSLYRLSEAGRILDLDSHVVGRDAGIHDLSKVGSLVRYFLDSQLIEADLASGKDANAYITLTALGVSEAESICERCEAESKSKLLIYVLRAVRWFLDNIVAKVAVGIIVSLLIYWIGISE